MHTHTHPHTHRILMSQMYEITNKKGPVMRFSEKVCFCSWDLSSMNNKPGVYVN